MSGEPKDLRDEILEFWFGRPDTPGFGEAHAEWFRKDAAFDAALHARFGSVVDAALAGGFAEWVDPRGTLARVLLLDQFTRNNYRDTTRAFAELDGSRASSRGGTAGASIAAHPGVGKVAFTGETTTGQEIMRLASGNVKKISLELGGKSPAIVFSDADEARTVDGVISGMRVTRQGQSCTAGSRLFLHRSIFDSFLTKLAGGLTKLKIGDPLDEATDMGAIINRKQFERVCSYIEDGLGRRAISFSRPSLPRCAMTGVSRAKRFLVR